MAANILIINGSPKQNGNTALLVEAFVAGAHASGARVETVRVAALHPKAPGCTSCRSCQKRREYTCAIDDDISPVVARMANADAIVLATPLYFFAASSYLKVIVDRMFSLYKWDNTKNTFTTPLAGKVLVLLASAYEAVGLDALERPFVITADYTGMRFKSLLIPNAGVSGDLAGRRDILERSRAFGAEVAAL